MELIISDDAAKWYKNELDLQAGDSVRFFVRYGGIAGNIPGFSLGVNVENSSNPHNTVIISKIEFFIEESDVWYFDGKNLHVNIEESLNEPTFSYISE